MKIIVVSDNHGLAKPIKDIYDKYIDETSLFFHCGDIELPLQALNGYMYVKGNNDYGNIKDEIIYKLDDDNKIFMTHGHHYLYEGNLNKLYSKAKEHGCNIVLFGHTHRFTYKVINGVHLINPGSLRYNRDFTDPSYAIINIDNNIISVKKITYGID